MFIVFEGTDGSGTSTQAKELYNRLTSKGYSVLHTHQPSDGAAGALLDDLLKHKKSISPDAFQVLFFADRLDHLSTTIIPALQNKTIVICERYNWSTIAYGAASGVHIDFLQTISSFFPSPDLTVFLDIPAAVSLTRVEQRGEQLEYFETLSVLQQVHSTMSRLANESFGTKAVLACDATQNKDIIADEIASFVMDRI